MGSTDGSERLQTQRHERRPVPAPVEAVVQFGYPHDLVSSTYQQLLSAGSSGDVIHTGNDASTSNGCVTAALLLVSVEAAINSTVGASGSHQWSHQPDLPPVTVSEGTVSQNQTNDELQGDGSGHGTETPTPSSSPRHQDIVSDRRDHEGDSPANGVDYTPSTPTTTEPAQASSSATTVAGSSTTNGSISTTSTGIVSVSANNDAEVSPPETANTPTPVTTTITGGAATSSDDVPGSQHSDPERTTSTTLQTTTTPSHVVERGQTPADDKVRERRRQLERLRALRAENRRLKARNVCRQCHQRPVALTLLPCGHFLFCQECGSSFNACPVCKKTVLADVRTFVS